MNNAKRCITVMGVPLDLGVSKLGVDMGPTAIRYAGIFDAFDHAGFDWADSGDLDVARNFALDSLPPGRRSKAKLDEIIRVSGVLAAHVEKALNQGRMPLVLGGDHSTAIGSVAGAAKAAGRMGLLWIDAHPDANTPETSPSGNIHGMPLAVALGHGPRELVHCHGFAPKVLPQDVCIVGARDIDPGETLFLRRHGIRTFTTFDIANQGLHAVMEQAVDIVSRHTDAVYVSFDTDVIEGRTAPGTGIVTRGGLSYREISFIMHYVGKHLDVAAMDVIEVNPLLDTRNRTAELVVELLMAALGVKYTDYEKHYLVRNRPDHSPEDD